MNRKYFLGLGLSLAWGLGVLLSCQQSADAMLVVQNGQPRATIVVAQDASAQVQQAARNLQEYIQKSSGAKLPIATTAVGNTVTVGQNAAVDTTGWTTWDKSAESSTYHKGIWKVTSDQAHSGTNSFMIKGLGRGAPIQDIPYEPGTYYVQVYCYVPKSSKVGTASVTLSVVGNSKIALPSTPIALEPGRWSNGVVPFTLTEDKTGKATAVRMLVLLDGFEPDGEIYVDDTGIYQIDRK